MIDVTQLTSLISAFRVETEKESISPETVGKLLQDITELLANASTDAERQILDDWKEMISQYYFIYDVSDANMPDQENLFLRLRARNLGDGSSYTSSIPLSPATSLKAGAMTASHVQALSTLQTAMQQVQSAVSSMQNSIHQHSNQLYVIQTAGYVVTAITQGSSHASRVYLQLTKHDVHTGEDIVVDRAYYLSAATEE